VDHQDLAEFTGVDQGLHLAVALVEPPHEAHGHQLLAGGLFGVHDPQGGVRRGGERLLTEHRLAGLDALQDVDLVRRAVGADHHRVHVGGVDQFGRRPESHAADAVGDRLGVGRVHVAHRDHATAGDHGVDALDVRLAHTAGADHPDTYSHVHIS